MYASSELHQSVGGTSIGTKQSVRVVNHRVGVQLGIEIDWNHWACDKLANREHIAVPFFVFALDLIALQPS
jgi:hypothetical protein